jgi:hypothetical protein
MPRYEGTIEWMVRSRMQIRDMLLYRSIAPELRDVADNKIVSADE